VLGVLWVWSFNYFLIGLVLLAVYALYFASKKSSELNKAKKFLPLNAFHYWIVIPFLYYVKAIFRDIGRLKGLMELK
jgi:hypothetical protein